MPVRIDDVAHRLVADLCDAAQEPWHLGLILRIHEEQSVIADRQPDIEAHVPEVVAPGKRVEAGREFHRIVGSLSPDGSAHQGERDAATSDQLHQRVSRPRSGQIFGCFNSNGRSSRIGHSAARNNAYKRACAGAASMWRPRTYRVPPW